MSFDFTLAVTASPIGVLSLESISPNRLVFNSAFTVTPLSTLIIEFWYKNLLVNISSSGIGEVRVAATIALSIFFFILTLALSTTAYLYSLIPVFEVIFPIPFPNNLSFKTLVPGVSTSITIWPLEFFKSAIITLSDVTCISVLLNVIAGVDDKAWSFIYPTALSPNTNLPFVKSIFPVSPGPETVKSAEFWSVPVYKAYPSPLNSICAPFKSIFPLFKEATAAEALSTFIELYSALILPLLFTNNPNPM